MRVLATDCRASALSSVGIGVAVEGSSEPCVWHFPVLAIVSGSGFGECFIKEYLVAVSVMIWRSRLAINFNESFIN